MRQKQMDLRQSGWIELTKPHVFCWGKKAAPAPQSTISVWSDAENKLVCSCSLRRQNWDAFVCMFTETTRHQLTER